MHVDDCDSMDAAIQQASALPFAFQASVFSKNMDAAMQAVQQLDVTAVMVNDHTAFQVDWMPFARRKQSGYGTRGIGYTMQDMTQDKWR
ncbi:aldehyde dehydrogenase family protein [Rhodobacteraceae bacterium]|nr:aldehyde dehydrogenase family protein [Paracoccaceae bacterium]